MKMRHAALVVTVLAAGCASGGGDGGTLILLGNKATVVFYRDRDNACKTATSPYTKASKRQGPVEWEVVDHDHCFGSRDVISLKFDKGDEDPLPTCQKATEPGKKKISCSLREVSAPIPARKYSVWLNGTKLEDPELEIGS